MSDATPTTSYHELAARSSFQNLSTPPLLLLGKKRPLLRDDGKRASEVKTGLVSALEMRVSYWLAFLISGGGRDGHTLSATRTRRLTRFDEVY